jgi:transposase-like protein
VSAKVKADWDAVLALYPAVSVREICQKVGCSHVTVYENLAKRGISPNKLRHDRMQALIRRVVNDGIKVQAVALEAGVPEITLYQHLRRHGYRREVTVRWVKP